MYERKVTIIMNISRIIKYANYVSDDQITDKMGRKILKDISDKLKKCDIQGQWDETMLKFYKKCIEEDILGMNNENHMSEVFWAAIVLIMVNQEIRIKNFESATFEQGKLKQNLCDNLEVTMLKINNKYKRIMYKDYSDTYNRENIKRGMFDYVNAPKKLNKQEWNNEITNKWKVETGEIFYDIGQPEWEYYKKIQNQNLKVDLKAELQFEVTVIELIICHYYREMLQGILDNIRAQDKFEEIQIMLDHIIDDLDRLPIEKKQYVLDIHKNKIKNLYLDIQETINKMKENDDIEYSSLQIMHPARLSREETEKYNIQLTEEMLEKN